LAAAFKNRILYYREDEEAAAKIFFLKQQYLINKSNGSK
jgi:hypothetical protein